MKQLGRKRGWCPYFFARQAVGRAHILVHSYAYLLDPKIAQIISRDITRQTVVIFDEAHNFRTYTDMGNGDFRGGGGNIFLIMGMCGGKSFLHHQNPPPPAPMSAYKYPGLADMGSYILKARVKIPRGRGKELDE